MDKVHAVHPAPQLAELRWIDGELARVNKARAWLVHRRMVLLAELAELTELPQPAGQSQTAGQFQTSAVTQPAQPPAPASRPASPQLIEQAPPEPQSPRPSSPRTPHELSARAVARLLLAAGAILVVIAAVAFTVASWSSIGPAGRCAILLGVSALMLTGPLPLARRGLAATAEAVAAIGLALTIADAYLIVKLAHVQLQASPFGIALVTVGLAVLWAGYARLTSLRGPWLAAIVLAQAPGLYVVDGLVRELAAPAFSATGPLACGLVATAAADVALGARAHRREHRPEALTCSLAAAGLWITGVMVVVAVEVTGPDLTSASWAAAAFALAAVVGIRMWPANGVLAPTSPQLAVLSGVALTGLAAPIAVALPSAWRVLAFAGVSAATVASALGLRGRASEGGLAWIGNRVRLDLVASGAAAGLVGSALDVLPNALRALFGPYPGATGSATPSAGWPTLLVLTLLASVCWLAPIRPGNGVKPRATAALTTAIAALAAVSIPAALHLAGWPRLAVLTAGVVALATIAVLPAGAAHPEAGRPATQHLPLTAALAALAIALTATGWSLATSAATITELAILTVTFTAAAARARNAPASLTLTSAALASAAGLAFAAPLAAGWSSGEAALAALAIPAIAVVTAARLLQKRPAQGLVLDVGALVLTFIAAIVAARSSQPDFALTAALGALLASGTAWLRNAERRTIALLLTCVAGLAAGLAQAGPLTEAWFRPQGRPWHGHPLLGDGASHGLPFAVVVLTIVLAAGITAAGAWRGQRRSSLDALAVALPVMVVPATLASGFGYVPVLAGLLALTIMLTGWSALTGSLASAGGAVVATLLTLDWALAARTPTLTVLGCLTAAYLLCAWRTPAARSAGRAITASLTVVTAAGLATAAVLATGGSSWQAGLVVLPVAAAALLTAARLSETRLSRPRLGITSVSTGRLSETQLSLAKLGITSVRTGHLSETRLSLPRLGITSVRTGHLSAERPKDCQAGDPAIARAVELAAWLVTIAGTAACLTRPAPASLALATSGALCLGSAARRDRRPLLWAGLTLLEAAWCVWLAHAGVGTPEAYTIPAGLMVTAFGWQRARRQPELNSWLAYGPGIVVLLAPSLGAAWQDDGWLRPALLGVAAAAIALAGARLRLQAPLLLGIAVAALDAGRQLAPEIRTLTQALPGWVPIAIIGAALLWAGATYEARLRNLTSLRHTLGHLH